MVAAYNLSLAGTPFQKNLTLPPPSQLPIPFKPDPELIAKLSNISRENPWRHKY